jgi:hypothetical protein
MDRNPHVRELMCRELAALGHSARTVQTGAEALRLLAGPEVPQVLILDPEALSSGMQELPARLAGLSGRVVTVLHMYAEDQADGDSAGNGQELTSAALLAILPSALVVEKQVHLGALKSLMGTLARSGHFGRATGKRGA